MPIQCSRDSRSEPARWSCWPRTRRAPSSTTTSAPSTSCSACCARRKGLPPASSSRLDITVEEVRAQVARIVGQGDEVTTGQIPFTPRAKKVLELALREALSLGHNYIGTEHILLGLVRENEGVAARILLDFDADAEKIRNEIIRMLSGPGRRQQGGAAGAPGEKSKSSKLLDQFGRNFTKQAQEGQARPGGRPPDGDRADHADPLTPPEEQPRADRRARRRQDRDRRGPRPAHLREPGARAPQGQADLLARPRRARRRLEVPRRVRGAPEEGDEGDPAAGRHHPVHRRAAQPRRCRRRRGRHRRRDDLEAGARPRRAPDDRRDHARRVPQVPRARRRPRAPLPAGARRRAVGRRHRPDPARPARPLRGAPPLQDHRRGAARRGRRSPTATSRTATSPTRRSTSSTRPRPACGSRR